MFSQVSVILSRRGGMPSPRSLLGWVGMPGSKSLVHVPPEGTPTVMYTPLVLTSSGDHRSGWYASYWNAFLFVVLFIPACHTFVKKKFYNGTGNYRNELPIEKKFGEKEIISCHYRPRDGYCCGRFASYWNAFLFAMCPRNQILLRLRF